jgi:hypothetical protein
LANLSKEWIHENEGPETWSPYDILGHLIHGEKTDWVLPAKIILDPKATENFEEFSTNKNTWRRMFWSI